MQTKQAQSQYTGVSINVTQKLHFAAITGYAQIVHNFP